MPKRTLRQEMLIRRRAITNRVNQATSRLIQERFLALPEYVTAKFVGLYAAIGNEIETTLVLNAAIAAGKRVVYPAVVGNSLVFRQIDAFVELKPGFSGILEPAPHSPVVPINRIDVVVVPGVAFDMQGHRIGYGKGFYDKTLHSLEGTGKLVGFCHDFQLVAEIAGEPHDVMMDMVLTEARLIRPRG